MRTRGMGRTLRLVAAAAAATALAVPGVAVANQGQPAVTRDSSGCPVFNSFPGLGEADTYALTSDGRLISFHRDRPALQRSSAVVTGVTGTIAGIDVRPATGALYALAVEGSTGRLYTIDPGTGAASLASTLDKAVSGSAFGVDFNPVPDRLRVVSDAGQNLRINVDTGATLLDGALTYAGSGGAVAAGVSAAAYTNSAPPSPRTVGPNVPATGTTLYDIDTNLDVLVVQSPPNDGVLNPVGPLGFDVSSVNGFDIDAATGNSALAAVQISNARPSLLAEIDLSTGRARLRGAIGCAATVTGLAFKG